MQLAGQRTLYDDRMLSQRSQLAEFGLLVPQKPEHNAAYLLAWLQHLQAAIVLLLPGESRRELRTFAASAIQLHVSYFNLSGMKGLQ